jgi:hypothetical protein
VWIGTYLVLGAIKNTITSVEKDTRTKASGTSVILPLTSYYYMGFDQNCDVCCRTIPSRRPRDRSWAPYERILGSNRNKSRC